MCQQPFIAKRLSKQKINEQRAAITAAIEHGILQVGEAKSSRAYQRKLGAGERGVLDLALEQNADLLIIDDRKARNEAREHGLALAYTTDILRAASERNLVSYADATKKLREMGIFLPA